jgi:hypothetical protein
LPHKLFDVFTEKYQGFQIHHALIRHGGIRGTGNRFALRAGSENVEGAQHFDAMDKVKNFSTGTINISVEMGIAIAIIQQNCELYVYFFYRES